MHTIAYPGSFDPIHRGHVAIIEDLISQHQADQVCILVGKNPDKKSLLPLEQRLHLIRHATSHIPQAVVDTFDGLLVDYLATRGINTIVRGIRDDKDRSFEKSQEYYNNRLHPAINTEYIECRPEYFHLSSSAVKMLIARGGNIGSTDHLLTLPVKKATEEALCNQHLVGITGVPGSGKSYISQQFAQFAYELGIPHHLMEMDKLRHQIAFSADPQFFGATRERVCAMFPEVSKQTDGSLSRESLRNACLGNTEKVAQLTSLVKDDIMSLMRSTLYKKQGAIFVENALFAEHPHLLPIVNNDMIVVDVDAPTQVRRIKARNSYYDSDKKVQDLLGLQFGTAQKLEVIQRAQTKEAYGKTIVVHNPDILDGNDTHLYTAFLEAMQQIDPAGKLLYQGVHTKLECPGTRPEGFEIVSHGNLPVGKVYASEIRNMDEATLLKHIQHCYA